MKSLLVVAGLLFASAAFAEVNCVTNSQGKAVCSNGQKAVAVNGNSGKVTTAQQNPGGRHDRPGEQWGKGCL